MNDLNDTDVNTTEPTHTCQICGTCCRNFVFVQVTQEDIDRLEAFTGLSSEEFTYPMDETGVNRFMRFRENGDCFFLSNIDGAYSCSVYEARSQKCRDYPTTDCQRETCLANRSR